MSLGCRGVGNGQRSPGRMVSCSLVIEKSALGSNPNIVGKYTSDYSVLSISTGTKIDVFYIAPNGNKFRSKPELSRFMGIKLISAILTLELDTLPSLPDSSAEAFGCSESASCIINPHASSFAKLTVLCITAAFIEGSGQNEKKRKLLSSSVPNKRQRLDSFNELPLYRLLDLDSSAFPTHTRPSSSSSMSEDEVKIETKPEIKFENRVFDSNNGKDTVAVALIALFGAFLRVLVNNSIDLRILFILVSRTSIADESLSPDSVRLSVCPSGFRPLANDDQNGHGTN